MPKIRTRLAVALISITVIALELGLMRGLALRFWHHFAYLVISVALLGFGASGTALTLLRKRIVAHPRGWACGLAMALALSVPISSLCSRAVPLDVHFLAWDLTQLTNVALLELLMFVPFFLAGCFVGVVLMDVPARISGHYAVNLVGSGIGAVLAVLLMYVLSTGQLLITAAAIGYVAGAILLPWRRIFPAALGVVLGAAFVVLVWWAPHDPVLSKYKRLWFELAAAGEVIHHAEGPLGRIDVVAGESIHHHPGLGWEYVGKIPPHVLLIVDGDQTSGVYDCKSLEDWTFLDSTTAAAAYHLRPNSRVCVVGAGGGADIGLALLHGSPSITALEMNPQIIEIMKGALFDRGGSVYQARGVEIVNQESRGFFASTTQGFDIVQVPPVQGFGASGAGLQATQESYLYTVESFGAMLDRLTERGLLCITQEMQDPPRGGLRAFDIAVQALRGRKLEPSRRLVMIRSRTTVTVLVSGEELNADDLTRIRSFCEQRGFDLCYLPDMDETEANRYHELPRPYYFEYTHTLLGSKRDEFLKEYLFEVQAPTDDRPYFWQFFRLRKLPEFLDQLGPRARAYLERSYLMLLAALGQAVVLGAVLIVLPLTPGIRALKHIRGKGASLGYFLMLGLGFMLLEMGLLQKLILYLAHPIYSSAAVIASFLVFAGLGSELSRRWEAGEKRIIAIAASAVVILGLGYAVGIDRWLRLTQGAPLLVRFAVAALTIAPLGLAMGHMFPTGLRRVGRSAPPLVPWVWAVNGFASVLATVAAPLLAMNIGFSGVTLIAIVCYALAGALGGLLPPTTSE